MADRFEWTTEDGRTVSLVPFDRLPSGVFRKARRGSELDMTFDLIEAGADEDTLAVLDDLPVPALNELFSAWTDAAGTDLPKS